MRIEAADYAPLEAFCGWALEHLMQQQPALPADANPMAVLGAFEARSAAMARKSLAMAIGDILEMTGDLSMERLAVIDAALEAEGILTLTAVRARFGRVIRAVMKRGVVRNEREYYALRNVVESMIEPEQGVAQALLAAFETRG